MLNIKCIRFRKGFTLIEILVVLAIIGLLASIVIVRANTTRARARDAERVSEIKSLQNALELYFTNNNGFPITSSAVILDGQDGANNSVETDLISARTIPAIPSDPNNSGNFQYRYLQNDANNGATYEIQYYLETDSILGKDGEEAGSNGGTPNPQRATP
jgi:type II secretion system protein G